MSSSAFEPFHKAEEIALAVCAQGTGISQAQTTAQVVPFKVKAVGEPLLPDDEPLKPGAELRVAPAGMEPLYAALVMVTALPLWV